MMEEVMIFVIGGAFQGKTEFVKEHFHIPDKDIVDGKSCEFYEIYKAKAIKHFESIVYRLIKVNQPVLPVLERLLEENTRGIIISTEIGCGLVPVDAFEREYREAVGRSCCQIAKRAEQVYRVQCGIAVKIFDSRF
jgi:adenosylcobinamide kinase/adenosylcobinamide-phosphate guanylyltransferase